MLEVKAPRAGHWMRINLEAETGGLTLDRSLSGPVNLTLTPPAGVTAASPASVTLTGGRASFRVKFPAPGYYLIAAAGPAGQPRLDHRHRAVTYGWRQDGAAG